MRVAMDHEPLKLTSGGIKRYVEELTRALREAYPLDDYIDLPEPRSLLERRWWLYGAEKAAAAAKADVFHGTNFAVPFCSRRATVLTLHDLSPWHNREWQSGKPVARIRRRTPYLLPRASHVITPSEAVRTEALKRFKLSPERVTAVPLAASELFRPVREVSDPYFLFVGTLEPRKGIGTMLEAWRATGRKVPLRIAGRRRADFPPIEREPNLHLLGEVPDSELPALYTNAQAVIYPSEYEGFGLPVLEAMQCGANVITSCDPALRELGGAATLQVSGGRELRAALVEPPSSERREAAMRRASQYSWRTTAQRTHVIYEAVLAK